MKVRYKKKALDDILETQRYISEELHNSAERYNELERVERNAVYLEKLERGLTQIHAGQGIVKTMDELEALAGDGA